MGNELYRTPLQGLAGRKTQPRAGQAMKIVTIRKRYMLQSRSLEWCMHAQNKCASALRSLKAAAVNELCSLKHQEQHWAMPCGLGPRQQPLVL